MSRIHALVLVLGALLVVFGFTLDMFSSAPRSEVRAESSSDDGAASRTTAPLAPRTAVGRGTAEPSTHDRRPGETELELRLNWTRDGAPAAGVAVDMWRRASGQGAAFRSARRLVSGRTTDASGTLVIGVPAEFDLDLVLRAGPSAEIVELRVSALAKGERRVLEHHLARAPEPLTIRIVDDATATPIAGASVRAVSRHASGVEDFPGSSDLLARTDGHGTCELAGSVRRAPRLLFDAAGHGPAAIDPRDLASTNEATIRLSAAASIEVVVTDAADEPIRRAEVQARFTVGGHTATVTAETSRRGRAKLERLPAGARVTITTTPPGSSTYANEVHSADPLAPSEEREVRLRLGERVR